MHEHQALSTRLKLHKSRICITNIKHPWMRDDGAKHGRHAHARARGGAASTPTSDEDWDGISGEFRQLHVFYNSSSLVRELQFPDIFRNCALFPISTFRPFCNLIHFPELRPFCNQYISPFLQFDTFLRPFSNCARFAIHTCVFRPFCNFP